MSTSPPAALDGTPAFDLTGPLPSGVTVLEASAGTGKTFTIAALATRFVADGMDLDQLLLVTFTRAATGELRERVRERLVETERELARVLAGGELTTDDDVTVLLADGADARSRDLELVGLRQRRLTHAVANFDAATIETTHGFCQKVLDELGTLSDMDPDIEFVESVDDLVSEVVDDLYVRAFHRQRDESDPVRITRPQAGEIAAIAINNPGAPIHPLASDDANQNARRRLAQAARAEFELRKRRLGLMTHDDQLTRLLATLGGDSGPAAIESLRAQYRVVLIDEFQDTDPLQWEIVRRAFGDGTTTLVLIGDPKQAIYAFRGADVYAYLDAARTAGARATLDVNRRSDGPLLSAFDAFFDGAHLGEAEIVYRSVRPAPGHERSRLSGAPVRAALRLRVVDRTDPAVTMTGTGALSATEGQEFVARDLAQDIEGLLSSEATISGGGRGAGGGSAGSDGGGGTDRSARVVQPGDIAVLVRSRWQAGMIQQALEFVGVPVVIAGAGSVFETAAAQHWLRLLEALERPAASGRARAAALTPFVAVTAQELALADEAALENLHRRLHVWARVLREQGVATLAQTVLRGEHVPGRMLSQVEGERDLTDLEHVAQLLHAAASDEQLGVAAMTAWLRQRIEAAGTEGNDERTRRLDTDADAVQVLTFHRSKGLEFPIVYCPFLWSRGRTEDGRPPIYFHDPAEGGSRAIDVAGAGSEYDAHLRQYDAEERGEDLRLMYVALTRARHQAVLWWGGSYFGKDSALTRLLFSKQLDGNIGTGPAKAPSDEEATAALGRIAESAPGCVSVEQAQLGLAQMWSGALRTGGGLSASVWDRTLDARWRRTSYSAITAGAHEALVSSEPEARGVTDEPSPPEEVTIGAVSELPLAAMAAGPQLGTVVHRALERIDFTAPELEGALTTILEDETGRSPGLLGCSVAEAGAGLASALRTPLGGDQDDLALTDVKQADRLDELVFELPLAGGDTPAGVATLAAVSDSLAKHLRSDDPLADYAARLGDPSLSGVLRGYLTGSIDVVLRAGGRYVIVDYKTNWLGGPGETLSPWHYRPQALASEMQRSHYALQALLYSVALHRFLRWRVPGYEPERDLGGVRYLFLRGMTGTPGSGVFAWNPPAALISDLSDRLDGDGDS